MKKKIIIIFSITIFLVLFLFFSNKNEPLKDNPYYKKEYLKSYLEVNEEDRNDLDTINILLDKKYTTEEINLIYKYLSDKNRKKLLTIDYVSLNEFYNITNFDVLKVEEYNLYQKQNNILMKDAVTKVNLHLNEEYYSNINEITNPDDLLILVNKYNKLPSNYVPLDLESIGYGSLLLRRVAKDHLLELIAAAKLEGRELIPFSAYRSFDYQNDLYNYYVSKDGVSVVDTYSARPGHSEHQTGLAVDLKTLGYNATLSDSDYNWLKENAHLYGFIVRYPKEKSSITGYKEEPWHIRYIGLYDASKVYELKLTFDEYYDLYLKEY